MNRQAGKLSLSKPREERKENLFKNLRALCNLRGEHLWFRLVRIRRLLTHSGTMSARTKAPRATWHGRLHDISFVLPSLILFSAMIVQGFAFRQNKYLNQVILQREKKEFCLLGKQ